MKRFAISGIILFLLVAKITFAGDSETDKPFFISYENRLSIFHDTKIPIAENPEGKFVNHEFGTKYSFKAGIGVSLTDNLDLSFYYSRLNDNKQITKENFNGFVPLGTAFLYRTPDLNEMEGYSTGSYKQNIFDLELSYTFKLKNAEIGLMGGLRYARSDQILNVFNSGICGYPPNCPNKYSNERLLSRKSHGAGPRIGIKLNFPFDNNINLFGSASGALLFMTGQLNDWFESFNVDDRGDKTDVISSLTLNQSSTEMESNYSLELEGGVGYKLKTFPVKLEIGYRFDGHYGGLYSVGKNFLKIIDRGFENDKAVNHGPFLRTVFRF